MRRMHAGRTGKGRTGSRQAQAALEYVITYGWGFVIILVVLGVLAYFGFLNPSRYVPSRCEFGSQLQCVDYKLTGTGNGVTSLRFRNSFGDDINITDIKTANGGGTFSGSIVIPKGNISNIVNLTMPVGEELVKDDRATVQLIVTFKRASGGPLHNATGEIFATVQ